MGQLHNELRRGILSRALTLALGDARGAGGIERFGETLTPIIDLWDRPEWAALRDELFWVHGAIASAVVGEFSAAAVTNPAGSPFIITVEHFVMANPGATVTARWGYGTAAQIITALGATSANPSLKDRRPGVSRPTLVAEMVSLHNGSDAVLANAIPTTAELYDIESTELQDAIVTVPTILGPGQGYILACSTVNTAFKWAVSGRVRRAFTTELG